MLKEISTLLEVARKVLPRQWLPNKRYEMTDGEGNVIVSCATAKHAEYITAVSPTRLIALLEQVQEILSNRHRFIIDMSEVKGLRLYFQGIAFTEEDGLSFITSSKATEAITFHDKQSAERMLEFIDATITGIKTTIVKVGRYER